MHKQQCVAQGPCASTCLGAASYHLQLPGGLIAHAHHLHQQQPKQLNECISPQGLSHPPPVQDSEESLMIPIRTSPTPGETLRDLASLNATHLTKSSLMTGLFFVEFPVFCKTVSARPIFKKILPNRNSLVLGSRTLLSMQEFIEDAEKECV